MPPKNLPKTIGRYEIVDRLGQGGMGIVYRGRDPQIGRAVAIKLLRVSDDELRERFLQEARSAGNLQHPNIVTIFDFGEQFGQPFIVMQFVEGVTLSEQIRSGFHLSLSRKLELIEELSSGLDYAHKKGIVHRDVKPANVMIDRDGVVKILDFGIARVVDSDLTQIGAMMGTPNYMSPEQIERRPVDRRSDIFAVGLVIYELLSYRQAFAGETLHAVMNAIVQGAPVPLRELCPDLEPRLEAIVNRAIRKDPRDRYQTLAEMAADIAVIRARVGKGEAAPIDESTIAFPKPPATPYDRRTPRPGTQHREQLSKRRAERIEGHLQTAQRAFDAGQFAAGVEACEQAAMLDPDEPRVLDLLEKTREAQDREQVREWLTEAIALLNQQQADQASELVGRVLQLDPDSGEAIRLREVINELQRRQQKIAVALVRARESLVAGRLDAAILAASEVLIYDPAHEAARDLKRQALQVMDEQRLREARDRTARALVDEQKREFAAGRRHEALETLAQFSPPHDVVSAGLAGMRLELVELERLAGEERERQRREIEQQQQVQLQWIADQLDLATAAIGERRFDDAIAVLQLVERDSPATHELATLIADARAGKAALDADARRSEAEARRRNQIAEALTRAAVEFSAGDLAPARDSLGEVLALSPGHEDAVARLRQVEAAIEESRRRAALDREAKDVVQAARRQFDAGEQEAAIARLASFAPPHALVTRTRDELSALLARIDRERHEAEHQQRTESAREAVDRARQALWHGEFDAALRALDEAESLDPGNEHAGPLRARALAGREEAARRAEHERVERDALAEARRRQAEALTALLARGVTALAASDFDAAARLAQEALAIEAGSEEARTLKARAVEGEANRRQAAERAARTARIDEQRDRARAEADAGQFAEALDRLQRLERAEGPVAGLAELTDRIRASRTAAEQLLARAEERRREEQQARDRQAMISAALERAQATESARDAVAILIDVLRLAPDHRGCLDLLASRQAEIVSAIERLIDDREFDRALTALDETGPQAIGLPSLLMLRERLRLGQAAEAAAHQAVLVEPRGSEWTGGEESQHTAAAPPEAPVTVLPISIAAVRSWQMWGALAVGLLVAASGALFLRNRMAPQPEPAVLSVPAIVATTSIPEGAAPTPTPAPAVVTPTNDVEVERSVAAARTLLRAQNLPAAMAAIVAGLDRAADNVVLRNLLEDVLRAAAARADTARQAADRAGGAGRPAYIQASGHVLAASGLKGVNRAKEALDEYAIATQLFTEAAQEPPALPPLTATAASIPVAPPAIVTVPPTVMSSAPTTSVPPTTSLVPTIELSTVNRLLIDYAAASRSLDVRAIQRIYPGLPNSSRMRIEALRKDFSYCDYTFTNVRLVFSSATEATVRADSVEACKPRTAQKAIALPGRQEFHFSKSSSGAWTLAEVFTAQ